MHLCLWEYSGSKILEHKNWDYMFKMHEKVSNCLQGTMQIN